ncbi:MAG: hypothetical protein GEV12_09280 [Micromonosporaceae bacterium]|nr:hypothetical protein [Micromonosporaceae bacterium]
MRTTPTPRRRAWLAGTAAAATAVALAGVAGPAQAVVELPARIAVIDPPVAGVTYPGIDYGKSDRPGDDRHSKTTWRVVQETGNCCETYLTTTPGGRLLDFGGSFVNYSDDRGQTWRQVQPLTPLVNGEGAIVAAPGGDVLGVEWDPYSGDHLQFYKFEADTAQWLYTEMPVHTPFYDREWIAVVPGPVTIDGQTHEYVSFVKGGFPSKEVWFLSTDGLTYTDVSSKVVDEILHGGEVTGPLPTRGGAVNDWAQPNTNGGMTPLGGGGLLASPDSGTEWGLFDGAEGQWAAYRQPDGSQPSGRFQTDSAGRQHNLVALSGRDSFDYRISADGGLSWQSVSVTLPAGHAIEEVDFRAHRAAGVAAVAIRAQGPDGDQDLVYQLDITGDTPRLARMYEVGLGDTDATGGVGNDVRFDFASVTIFDDGRVAVSFLDSTTKLPSATNPDRNAPAIAIEGDTTLGGKVREEPTVPPELGEPYASYDFEAGAQDWTTAGVPTWSRSQPGVSGDGADDAARFGFGLEGPTQYLDNVDATLTSPPIAAPVGDTMLEFWLKTDTEAGFDGVAAQWSADGQQWRQLGEFSGRTDGYPGWQKVTLGFSSPGGEVQVRFRFTSDLICSALTPGCGEFTGARVDEVVVGSQAG